jgi:hypothetical protein
VFNGEFDLLVDTDRQQRDWLSKVADALLAEYPSNQVWGFVGAVMKGNASPGSRPFMDLSSYKTLEIQIRGASGGESVEIGIKDNTDPDNGTETKKVEVLTVNWQTLSYPLADFTTADLTSVYLLFEIVFNGAPARSVYFRDVRYVP